MTYPRSFFGVAEGVPFDAQAASRAYDWVMTNYDIAPFVVSKALFDRTAADLEYHREEVSKAVGAYMTQRTEDLKRGMMRQLVSKSAAGADLEPIAKAAEMVALLSKADYTPWERQRNAERQLRDAGGRFRVMNRKISPTYAAPMAGRHAAKLGIPKPEAHLTQAQQAAYQNDYLQVRDALRDLSGVSNDTVVTLNYSDGVSEQGWAANLLNQANDATADNGPVDSRKYAAGKRVVSIQADTFSDSPQLRTQAFDVMTGMGASPGFADFVTGRGTKGYEDIGTRAARGLDDITSNDPLKGWNAKTDPGTPTEQFWHRTAAASNLAQTLGGEYLPPKAQLALKTAAWVGTHAPQAEEVLGPTARKSAYRYRGVEKTPDPGFQAAINNARRNSKNGREAHDKLIQGVVRELPRGKGRPGVTVETEVVDSPLIAAMRRRLPDENLYELNRQAGTIPPSQGIVIDRNGKVVTEAVGYGDDWYLPFNLKNLNRLRGGEYIRTRAYGGPTTEDIYTGLVSGARGLTVVSHSGVFHVQFDDTFRGTRRYNDKAARMVKRYGMLLDAVQSKQVTLGDIPADRKAELEAEASSWADPDEQPTAYKQRLQVLLDKERRSPKLSEQATTAIKMAALDDFAQSQGASDWGSYALTRLRPAMQQQQAALGLDGDVSAAMDAKYGTPDKALATLGLDKKTTKQLEQAQRDYELSMNPLKLNGEGYQKALEALRDQFPYYFADLYFDAKRGKTDAGYIKPKFNRPEGALAGYFDSSINGQGKFTADQLNYQNLVGRGGKRINYVPTAASREKQEEEQAPSAIRRKVPGLNPERARFNAMVKVVENIRLADLNPDGRFAGAIRGAGAETANALRTNPAMTPAYQARFAERYPLTFGGTAEELADKLEKDPSLYAKVKAELDDIHERKLLKQDEDLWVAFKSEGGEVKGTKVPLTDDGSVDGEKLVGKIGEIYEFPSTKPGRKAEEYETSFYDVLGKSVLKPYAKELENVKLESADAALGKLQAIGKQIKGQYEDWDKYIAAPARHPAPATPVMQLGAQARALAEAGSLLRRYQASAPKPTVVEPPKTPEVVEQHTTNFIGMDPDLLGVIAKLPPDQQQSVANNPAMLALLQAAYQKQP